MALTSIEATVYLALKHLHMTTVALSGLLFVVRATGMVMEASWCQKKWLKILPHVNDTFLLASAIGMVIILGNIQPWMVVKLLALFVYIGLGLLALRFGRTKPVRAMAAVAALLTFGFIISVAVSKSPLGFFSG